MGVAGGPIGVAGGPMGGSRDFKSPGEPNLQALELKGPLLKSVFKDANILFESYSFLQGYSIGAH